MTLSIARCWAVLFVSMLLAAASATTCSAITVPLNSDATAEFSQSSFSVDNLVDGVFSVANAAGAGWANGGRNQGSVATMETVTDTPDLGDSALTFSIFSGGFAFTHTIGKFRISATTADRSLFSDGNDNGGLSVGSQAFWTPLPVVSVTSDNPTTTFSVDGNQIILAGGTPAEFETYTIVTSDAGLSGFTGFRLETFTDPSLGAGHGPGLAEGNGNYVIREFTVDILAVPEPSTAMLLGFVGLAVLRYRRRRT